MPKNNFLENIYLSLRVREKMFFMIVNWSLKLPPNQHRLQGLFWYGFDGFGRIRQFQEKGSRTRQFFREKDRINKKFKSFEFSFKPFISVIYLIIGSQKDSISVKGQFMFQLRLNINLQKIGSISKQNFFNLKVHYLLLTRFFLRTE